MSITDDLKDAWLPWMTDDLGDYAEAIGSMWAETELYALDRELEDGTIIPGWAVLLDPDLCPVPALPYLAMYVGEVLPVGISEPLAREWIKDAPNQRRGTNYAIFRAAQRSLEGQRHVIIRERDEEGGGGDDPDRITVATFTSETPNPTQVEADVRSVMDMTLSLNYQVLDGETWNDVDAGYADWQAVKDGNDTWTQVATALSGATSFARPRPI